MKYLTWTALTCALVTTPAFAAEFNAVQADKSELRFVSKQMGVPVEGSFRKFNATLAFDPAKPETGRAQIDIDLNSIDTGSEEANSEVKSKGWFDVKNFPAARFVSSSVKPLGGGRYEVAGKMTIKGRTRDVSAPFTLKQEGSAARLEGAFAIKRLQWGIGEGAWSDTETVADDVQIRFKFVALQAPQKK